MATFPSITPTYGTTKNSQPAKRVVQFGDGYEQRVVFGLNQNLKTYNLTFNVSETDSDTIETFLDARADDALPFDFTPPGESAPAKFICDEWSKVMPTIGRATITATFRQVIEP